MDEHISSVIPIEMILPAVGQGAMAIECREDDLATLSVISSINHFESDIAVRCERSFLAGLGGGCKTPIAAYARIIDGQLTLEGKVLSEDGLLCFEGSSKGSIKKHLEIGSDLANNLIKDIAGKIVIN
jgi:hydroxymethylbilane synthase